MVGFNDPDDRRMITVPGVAAYKAEKERRFNDPNDVGMSPVPGSVAQRTHFTNEAKRESLGKKTVNKKTPLGYPIGNANSPNGFYDYLVSIIGSILNEKTPLGYPIGSANSPNSFYDCLGSIIGSILAVGIFIVLMLIFL